jgi:hypothetical protein
MAILHDSSSMKHENDLPPVTRESVQRARADAARERVAMDRCPDCGLLNGLHRGVTGAWLGCDVARFADLGTRRRPTEPSRWNDPYTEVTAAVRAALVDGSCGVRMEIDMAHYSNDEQLNIASVLVRVAIGQYIAQLAERSSR